MQSVSPNSLTADAIHELCYAAGVIIADEPSGGYLFTLPGESEPDFAPDLLGVFACVKALEPTAVVIIDLPDSGRLILTQAAHEYHLSYQQPIGQCLLNLDRLIPSQVCSLMRMLIDRLGRMHANKSSAN